MYDSERFHLLALHLTKDLGSKRINKLLAHYNNPEVIFHKSNDELSQIINKSLSWTEYLKAGIQLAEKELNYTKRENIQIITIFDQNYPPLLRHCPDSPIILFIKGNLAEIKPSSNGKFYPIAPVLGVVGTRDATVYGIGYTEQIISELLNIYPEAQIISGLAKGIDIVAHKTCLNLNASTIGVVAHGFEYLFPTEHKFLANKMLERGAIITEYPSFVSPSPQRFPARNRIIAGMSEALLVVETKVKGGAIITADIAFNYNREVFALPGDISREQSLGCHSLIAQNKARIFLDIPNMISNMSWDLTYPSNKNLANLKEINSTKPKIKAKLNSLNKNNNREDKENINTTTTVALEPELQAIYDQLSLDPVHFDQLLNTLQCSYAELSTRLLNLELSGLVQALPGNLYVLTS